MGTITNVSELADEFAVIGKPLRSKKERAELLDEDHAPVTRGNSFFNFDSNTHTHHGFVLRCAHKHFK